MKSLKEIIRGYIRFYRSQKTNIEVRNFIKRNRNTDIKFEKNIWSKNWYWDYYYHRHPSSEKSKYYLPYDFFVYKIIPKLNNKKYSLYIEDKNMYDRIFGDMGVRLPKTIFRCINYIYMDNNYNIIEDITTFIGNIKQNLIIKKANDSHGGKNVVKYIYHNDKLMSAKNNKEIKVDELINEFGGDFIAQEVIIQHEALKIFHPYSLNTFRVNSYRSVKTNKVHVLMTSLRMGVNKSFVDNGSSGGVSIGLIVEDDNEAKLREFSFISFSDVKYGSHPDTNIKFKDYKIPNFPLIVQAVKKLSNVVPNSRIIAWDFGIDEVGNPVLIELNCTGGIWGSQETNGAPLFGDFSKEVKDYIDIN